jgi:hypothetical protein
LTSHVSRRSLRVRVVALASAASWVALVSVGGCGQTVEVGFDQPLVNGGAFGLGGAGGGLPLAGSPSGSAGAPAGGSGSEACVLTECRGAPYQCGNCEDDDQDGVVDSLDPDCLGPCDDDEGGLSTGLATSSASPCRQDCYFDGNAGPGNDKCEWNHGCDPLSVAPDYPPSGEMRCAYDPATPPMGIDCELRRQTQDQACRDNCLPLVPNGCDCFGCCELPGRSGNFYFVGGVQGAEGCQLDTLGDPERCPSCTPVSGCLNECEACETCIGSQPVDPLCANSRACPADSRKCAPDAPCDFGDYCVTGCCVRAPEPT